MSNSEIDLRKTIERYFEGELSGAQLLRAFAGYDRWLVPAGFVDGNATLLKFRFGESEQHLFLFSDQEAYTAARDKLTSEALGVQISPMAGHSIFASLGDDVDVVKINPFSEGEIHYAREQLPYLREWARIIEVEQALAGVLASGKGLNVIRDYDSYYLVMADDGSQKHVALAPDDRGRRLAALFTATDALDAYLDAVDESGMHPLRLNGEQLFSLLLKLPLDGMVFNCYGPSAHAFVLVFAGAILRGE